jgi:hypothetical protein
MTEQPGPRGASFTTQPPSPDRTPAASPPARGPMNRLIVPGQPGDEVGNPPPATRPAMRTGTGIFLITVGAILLFALRSGSPHWLNLQVVGVILILAGGLGLTLPRLARSRRSGDWLRRWVRPGQSEDFGVPFITDDQGGDLLPQAPDASAPTLADDLLSYEPHH